MNKPFHSTLVPLTAENVVRLYNENFEDDIDLRTYFARENLGFDSIHDLLGHKPEFWSVGIYNTLKKYKFDIPGMPSILDTALHTTELIEVVRLAGLEYHDRNSKWNEDDNKWTTLPVYADHHIHNEELDPIPLQFDTLRQFIEWHVLDSKQDAFEKGQNNIRNAFKDIMKL